MRVTVVGAGYVGLVTGATLAERGHDVTCVDSDLPKVRMLEAGGVPIHEPGLPELIAAVRKSGRLGFGADVAASAGGAEVVMMTVGTPTDPQGRADLSSVEAAARTIATGLEGYAVVVEKSTVPVRTGDRVRRTMERNVKPGVEFDVASNPEFLREGTAVEDARKPSRIVLGVPNARAEKVLRRLYEGSESPILVTNVETAEMIKHASNAFLATKISFVNAVARLCEKSGANVEEVARGMGLDPRIGAQFLRAGVGYGGSCFAKDLEAFADIASQLGYEFRLLREVQAVNREQRAHVVDLLRQELWVLREKRVALLGLAFKPDTDDIRDAPALDVAQRLRAEGATVRAHDPVAGAKAKAILPDLDLAPDPYAAAEGADALVLVTEWPAYKALDFTRLRKVMRQPVIVDARNLWDPAAARAAGFHYRSIGRP